MAQEKEPIPNESSEPSPKKWMGRERLVRFVYWLGNKTGLSQEQIRQTFRVDHPTSIVVDKTTETTVVINEQPTPASPVIPEERVGAAEPSDITTVRPLTPRDIYLTNVPLSPPPGTPSSSVPIDLAPSQSATAFEKDRGTRQDDESADAAPELTIPSSEEGAFRPLIGEGENRQDALFGERRVGDSEEGTFGISQLDHDGTLLRGYARGHEFTPEQTRELEQQERMDLGTPGLEPTAEESSGGFFGTLASIFGDPATPVTDTAAPETTDLATTPEQIEADAGTTEKTIDPTEEADTDPDANSNGDPEGGSLGDLGSADPDGPGGNPAGGFDAGGNDGPGDADGGD